MVGFIPMKDTVTIYKTGTTFDEWGQPVNTVSSTHKCQLLFNEDLRTILNNDGLESIFECTIVIHGKPNIAIEDWVQFKDPLDNVCKLKVVGISFFRDWGNKIVATGIRAGAGKGY